MALRSAPLLLPVLVAVALRDSCFGSSLHSLKYFSISEPSHGQPHYVIVGYVDDQVFVHYDSHSRRMQPQVSWMEKVGKKDPQYWDKNTQILCGGLHTLQVRYGCELYKDRTKEGFDQFAYDGRTFLAFDKETLTWVALSPQAQITQRKWDAIPGNNQREKSYLEEKCIEWLEKYLSYKQEMPQRTEPPMVTVSTRTKELEDGMETHVCRLDGFYPREIDVSWTRDGEFWRQDTLHGSVAPCADGTFHTWFSIRIDPQERGCYWCHVEHDGLQEPLDVALEEPKSMGIFIYLVFGYATIFFRLGVIVVWILGFFKKRRDDYTKALVLDKAHFSQRIHFPHLALIPRRRKGKNQII